jgi:hypothetical protein
MKRINRIFIELSVSIIDLLYQQRYFQRFWVLETIARAPYFSFLSVLHFRESLGLRGKSHLYLMEEHFKQSANETEHLEVMESRGGNSFWIDRVFAYHLVLVYYWLMVGYYLIAPVLAYDLNVCIEEHAVKTYRHYLEDVDFTDEQINQILNDEQSHVKELKNAQVLIAY